MFGEFERELSFEYKPKAKLVGELKSIEVVCPMLEAVPSLSLILTESVGQVMGQVFTKVLILEGRHEGCVK